MIEPWQVWNVTTKIETQYMLVVSSDFHLRLNVGRIVTVVPLSAAKDELDYRPLVFDNAGENYAVLCDQTLTILSARLVGTEPAWTLLDREIEKVQRVLKHMVAFA